MTVTSTDDIPAFVAERPEHCDACYRHTRPDQTYYLTIEQEILCADCALGEGLIRVRDDLAVEVRRDRLLVQCDKAAVGVFPGEIRHLVECFGGGGGEVGGPTGTREVRKHMLASNAHPLQE